MANPCGTTNYNEQSAAQPPSGECLEGDIKLANSESTIDEINRKFPDIEAFRYNGMYYAKLSDVVIAAAPDSSDLREQICDYLTRMHQARQ
jgi:hypothetical protein